MYAFSLKPTGRKVDDDVAPPPPIHVIRAPSETTTKTAQHLPFESAARQQERPISRHTSNLSGSTASQEHAQQQQEHYPDGTSASAPPLQVHNVSAYTDMRDAADWSAVIQRERTEKRLRALALHDAAKAAEQRRRAEAESQSRREAQRRKEDRQQLRAAAKDAEAMAAFQARNTQFLRNQQRLMDLGASVRHAEAQRAVRARDAVFQTWADTRVGSAALCSTAGWVSPSSATASQRLQSMLGGAVPAASMSMATVAPSSSASAAYVPSKETELRNTAQRTEDAYVQLSLAYRNEAHRSRAAANILAAAGNGPCSRTGLATEQGSLTSSHASASLAPLPFRTTPAMYSHDSAEHMGTHAREIPTTYIPAYFDDGKGASPATPASPAALSAEVMPLPLLPAPVSQTVSDTLRDTYYPWAALADPATASARRPRPPRDAYLPVERWGEAHLHASVYGHGTTPDGSMREPGEQRKMMAALKSYTTIPQDNATATGNSAETVAPMRSGKRMEVWL